LKSHLSEATAAHSVPADHLRGRGNRPRRWTAGAFAPSRGGFNRFEGDSVMNKKSPYDQVYVDQESYWGKKPSAMCGRVIEIIGPGADFHPRLLDLGCGVRKKRRLFCPTRL